ncbi:MAG TPA: glycerophosphodiester phosphodiesterase [Terriglobales bacterium]|nr:glycerophosphodiester phosphodiesterase [Terriglobales bacterium]
MAPILLGHRGARAVRSVPENTIVSFDLALEHGCDGVEFDLRLTSCGRALVCHNPKVGKVTVSRATARQLLHLPCLDAVLRHYGHRIFLDIEIKVKGMESNVLAALRKRPLNGNYVISSFLPEVIMELKARSASVPTGIICQKASQLMRWRELPAQYIIIHYSLLTRRLIDLIHGTGKKVFVWTVNDSKSMVRLANWGVDGIISDDTKLLAQTLRS